MPRAAAAQAATDSALVEEARRLIAARVKSYLAGDSAAFHRLIAPGYVNVNDSGSRWPGGRLIIARRVR